MGVKRYPLVLMLEPLFRCNLACAGCGKIDYPDRDPEPAPVASRSASRRSTSAARRSCRSPAASRCCTTRSTQIVEGIIARKKFVYLCTNALLLEKKIDQFKPNPYLRLVGPSRRRPRDARPLGLPGRRLRPRGRGDQARPRQRGFRVNINCTLFDDAEPERVAAFFDDVMAMGVDGITVSPGYAYERAPDQAHFLNRRKTKELFRDIFQRGQGQEWAFSQSLAVPRFPGRQPDLPLHALGQSDAQLFRLAAALLPARRRLREDLQGADGDDRLGRYGTGNYEKCADCMVHAATRRPPVMDAVKHPLKAALVALRASDTDGPMAPEIVARQPAPGRIRVLAPCRGDDGRPQAQVAAHLPDRGRRGLNPTSSLEPSPPGEGRVRAPTASSAPKR